MIRLLARAGLQVRSADGPYGYQQYGAIGKGISTEEGLAQLQANEFRELDDPITAVVYPLGTVAYGGNGVREGEPTVTFDRTRFLGDDVFSKELIEDETLTVEMRLFSTGELACPEFVEV